MSGSRYSSGSTPDTAENTSPRTRQISQHCRDADNRSAAHVQKRTNPAEPDPARHCHRSLSSTVLKRPTLLESQPAGRQNIATTETCHRAASYLLHSLPTAEIGTPQVLAHNEGPSHRPNVELLQRIKLVPQQVLAQSPRPGTQKISLHRKSSQLYVGAFMAIIYGNQLQQTSPSGG